MQCQNCGATNSDNYVYCERCGVVLARPREFDESLIQAPKQEIIRAVMKRAETDYMIPIWIVFLPLLLGVAGSVIGFVLGLAIGVEGYSDPVDYFVQSVAVLAVLMVGSVASEVIYAFIIYRLVKRANDHYTRERELRAAVLSLVRATADTPERRLLVTGDLHVMDAAHSKVERSRNPLFWAFAAVLPAFVLPLIAVFLVVVNPEGPSIGLVILLVGSVAAVALTSLVLQLYTLYFLGEAMADHDRRWSIFSTAARIALSKLGFPPGKAFRVSQLPRRNSALNLVLTLLTGIFLYYWLYTLAKDPNQHFSSQWGQEDNIVSSIAPELANR
jgi:hypothetical protein